VFGKNLHPTLWASVTTRGLGLILPSLLDNPSLY